MLHPKTVTFSFFSLACDGRIRSSSSDLLSRGEVNVSSSSFNSIHLYKYKFSISFSTVPRSFLVPFIRRERESKPICVNSLALVFRHDILTDITLSIYALSQFIIPTRRFANIPSWYTLHRVSFSISQVAKKKKEKK